MLLVFYLGITPGLHFHLAASVNAETDIPLVPSISYCNPRPAFVLHWLDNKDMHFSLQAESLLEELARYDIFLLPRVINIKKGNLYTILYVIVCAQKGEKAQKRYYQRAEFDRCQTKCKHRVRCLWCKIVPIDFAVIFLFCVHVVSHVM